MQESRGSPAYLLPGKGFTTVGDRIDDSRLIFSAITHYRRWLTQLLPSIVPDVDISYQQINVLYLVRTVDASMAEMARILGVAPTVITGLVDRLEARGLIRREAHPSDRRRIQLVLTERGNEISVQVENAIAQRIEDRLQALSERDREHLRTGLELLEKLTIDLEKQTAGSTQHVD